MELVMSGSTYGETCECSSVPQEENWPTPIVRRRGKGWQYVYEVTEAQDWQIKSHVLQLYEGWFGYAEAAQDRAKVRGDLRRWGLIE